MQIHSSQWTYLDELKTDLLLDTTISIILAATFLMMMTSFIIITQVTRKVLKLKYAVRYDQFNRILNICAVWSVAATGLLGLRYTIDGFFRQFIGNLIELNTQKIGSWPFLVSWSLSIVGSEFLA